MSDVMIAVVTPSVIGPADSGIVSIAVASSTSACLLAQKRLYVDDRGGCVAITSVVCAAFVVLLASRERCGSLW